MTTTTDSSLRFLKLRHQTVSSFLGIHDFESRLEGWPSCSGDFSSLSQKCTNKFLSVVVKKTITGFTARYSKLIRSGTVIKHNLSSEDSKTPYIEANDLVLCMYHTDCFTLHLFPPRRIYSNLMSVVLYC
jgi:hypothetical protein